jgi:putative ABC transport system substrate-binding protein
LIDYRWAEGRIDRLPALAAELIQLRVDAIVTYNNAPVAALQQATRTIPIVAANMGDPVGSGFVASLAHPDKNVTGLTNLCGELAGKRPRSPASASWRFHRLRPARPFGLRSKPRPRR